MEALRRAQPTPAESGEKDKDKMKKQQYTIHAYDRCGGRLKYEVLASSHMQHVWNETELQDLSVAGAEKIKDLRQQGYRITVEIGGRDINLLN